MRYIKGQLTDAIQKLEQLTKKSFDYDRFHEIMKISSETARWWKKASLMARSKPSPLNGFDLFNYMAVIVCMRGRKEGLELFKLWVKELEEKQAAGLGPWKDQDEKIRILWDGIACWPYLSSTYIISSPPPRKVSSFVSPSLPLLQFLRPLPAHSHRDCSP